MPLDVTEEKRRSPAMRRSRSIGAQSWLLRPSQEYQHAFDLCAVKMRRREGPKAVLASSPFYARELLKRLEGCQATLTPVGEWDLAPSDAGDLLGPEVERPVIEPLQAWDRRVSVAVWAEPTGPDSAEVLSVISRHLALDGSLFVICSGWLSRFLPEWQRDGDRPARSRAGPAKTSRWLRQYGIALRGIYGFHGPISIAWGYAFRLLDRLARADLADRCHFKMRASYVARGWRSKLVPVALIAARKV